MNNRGFFQLGYRAVWQTIGENLSEGKPGKGRQGEKAGLRSRKSRERCGAGGRIEGCEGEEGPEADVAQ